MVLWWEASLSRLCRLERISLQIDGYLATQAAERLRDYHPFGMDDIGRQFQHYLEDAKRQAMGALAANLPEATVRRLLEVVDDGQ
jgi:hypothetical protein